MADQPKVEKSPWHKPLRQALHYVRQRIESYPLLKRITSWWPAHTDNPPPRAVFCKSDDLWPCGTRDEPLQLRYSYIRRANNDIQRNRESKIQAVIKHIEEEVPGVKFDRVNENSRTAIRIALDYKDPHGKMWSRVGREAENIDDDKPTMNLSEVTGHGSGEILEGTGEYIDIMHEFFHALGMYHEHQHPELNYTISETAVRKDMEKDGWSRKDIKDNMGKLSRDKVGPYSPQDNLSCMNYHIHRKWTKEGSEVKKNYKPSDIDWAFLNLMYPPREQRRFEQALSKCGINLANVDRECILGLYMEGEWGQLRSKIESVSRQKKKSIFRFPGR